MAVRGLLLLLDVEGATRLGEEDGGVIRPLLRCHELVLPAEKLVTHPDQPPHMCGSPPSRRPRSPFLTV
jgi:hypothetical protein